MMTRLMKPLVKRLAILTSPLVIVACAAPIETIETETSDARIPYACSALDDAADGPAIVGGQKLKRESRVARSVVFLLQTKEGENDGNICTATVVSAQVLMTAGHCVDQGTIETRVQRTAAIFDADPLCQISRKNRQLVLEIEKISIHPDYEKPGDEEHKIKHDIALIKLKSPLPEGFVPMPVAKQFIPMDEDTAVFAAGFGVTTDYKSSDQEPPLLRFTKIKYFDNTMNYKNIQNIATSPRLIFNQSEKGGACSGDSGGPALVRQKGKLTVIGVASQVYSRGSQSSCRGYVLHTSVSFHNKWLKETFSEISPTETSPF